MHEVYPNTERLFANSMHVSAKPGLGMDINFDYIRDNILA
jgi:hypothetical protein